MAGSRRRSTKPSTSYQEVDSDVDMDQEERVEARKAKAAKAKARSKIKRTTEADKVHKDELSPTLEFVLALPLEMLAEVSLPSSFPSERGNIADLLLISRICTHLDPQDLLNLCRTSRVWRTFLLSRRARTVWATVRRREKLPLLSGYSEIKLAVLVFGESCWECAAKRGELDCYFRTRLCAKCRKQLVVAKDRTTSRVMFPSIHRRASECCLSSLFRRDDFFGRFVPSPMSSRSNYCLVPELEASSHRLF
ncbi:hypothetical protein BCR35DRAFT_59022 [Leucosporidium creatinivorum]|uniref:F-box domain-containing protein n=1 Tax=Leucosporidium creatinivorum TaxID=106004 RepID=A0A1Y2FM83_9BASI|nr:hypothetical protein BCR35DRAFT_59022 [Leucosporidium creatinivorum]